VLNKIIKQLLIFILFILISAYSIGQIITKAKVDIKNNTYVLFHTLHNSGVNGEFNYDADLTVPGDWINDATA
jgi:hypothetical protein